MVKDFNMDMDFIKDLPIDLKRILFNILFIMPFWYMFIFFFNLYSIKDLTVVHIIFSFCLSLLSTVLYFLPTMFILSSIIKDKKLLPHYALEVNTIIICVLVSVFTYIGLINIHFCPIYSLKYIFIYSGVYLLCSVGVLVLSALFHKK